MRIVAGNYRGKKLHPPIGEDVRPTSDMARESVFNILRSKIGDFNRIRLLDVFAGTGAFGFEAVSRGAAEVCFIDKDITTVKKNAVLFEKEKNKINILKADVLNLPKAGKKYNMIFMDAPYNKGLSEAALSQLAEKGWIEDGALVIVETEKSEKLNFNTPTQSPFLRGGEASVFFEKTDERTYGLAKFTFLGFENS